jgi:hypothetical protein
MVVHMYRKTQEEEWGGGDLEGRLRVVEPSYGCIARSWYSKFALI